MIFESFESMWMFLMLTALSISIIFGFTAKQANFCTMGAVSDWVNFNDMGRMKAWMLAMAVGILSMGILEFYEIVNLSNSYPNYRNESLIYVENILGGLIFGIGMTYASGCGNKTLVRIGEGDGNSLITAISLGIAAYYMVNSLPNSEETIFTLAFFDWIRPLAIDLGHQQDIASFIKSYFEHDSDISVIRLTISITVATAILMWVFRKLPEARNIISGVIIGSCVTLFWVLSSNTSISIDEESYSPSQFLSEWDMVYEPTEENEDKDIELLKPKNEISYRPQSFTFINPVGSTYALSKQSISNLMNNDKEENVSPLLMLNMGIMAIIGVALGSLIASVFTKSFKPKINLSPTALFKSIFSGVLMGIGGILAIGCTVGQGVTGASTMSIGSLIALVSIITGSYLTQKFIYWNLMRD